MKYGYARVSTDDQNASLQINALEAAGCDEIFVDDGVSGTKRNRPALDRMLDAIEKGDVILVWKLDRLGRSNQHLHELVTDMRHKGASIKGLTDGIDTSDNSPHRDFFFAMMAAAAQLERDIISERTKAGMEAARMRGAKFGRPRIPDGEPMSRATMYRRKAEERKAAENE